MTNALDAEEVGEFVDKVDEVSRLIEGLSKGTISPEYVDRKMKDKQAAESTAGSAQKGSTAATNGRGPSKNDDSAKEEEDEEASVKEEERRARLTAKAAELKINYERKLKARARFEEYNAAGGAPLSFGTDYTKWDMWCPEDEEDDLISSITPNSSAFHAMEKDIDERHRKMVGHRQLAERMRVQGNASFKDRQYSEALRCYQEGIQSEKTNVTLHTNAAQAALKINCYVQAIEHCDKALNISDFMLGSLKGPLCTKAYQRRATAYRALQQYGRAVQDLEAAVANDPGSKELNSALAGARRDLEEQRKQKLLRKAMGKPQPDTQQPPQGKEGGATLQIKDASAETGASVAGGDGMDIEKLRRVEQMVLVLQQHLALDAEAAAAATSAPVEPSAGGSGPRLPTRAPAKDKGRASAPSSAVASASEAKEAAQKLDVDPAAVACRELSRLLLDDDLACVYLRECGGVLAASKIVCQGSEGVAPCGPAVAPSLDLLRTACSNDANLLLLPTTGVLAAAVQLLGSCSPARRKASAAPAAAKGPAAGGEAAAAARLLCTAVTCVEVRTAISKALGAAAGAGLAGMMQLLQSGDESTQAIALMVLGNCMVDTPTKAAMRQLLSEPATSAASGGPAAVPVASAGACLCSLMSTGSSFVRERALNLCGNMCGDAGLRQELIAQPGLVATAADAAMGGERKAGGGSKPTPRSVAELDVQLSAATMLYNISIESDAQEVILRPDREPNGDAAAGKDGVTTTTLTAGSLVSGLLALTQHSDLRLVARATGIVARCCKHPLRHERLARSYTPLLAVLRRCCGSADEPQHPTRPEGAADAASSASASSEGRAEGCPLQKSRFGAIDAATRALALLTHDDGPAGSACVRDLIGLGAVELLLAAIRQQLPPLPPPATARPALPSTREGQAPPGAAAAKPAIRESILGNAALCLSHLARSDAALPLLAAGDAVQPLVSVAHEGRGSTASKNAAIALARMSRQPALLLRLKELHGIEIIYQYVKP